MRLAAIAVGLSSLLLSSSAAAQEGRRPVELFVGLGLGNALCDNEKPDSQCPVNGGGAFTLGGGWRLSRRWLIGAELSFWGYKVRDSWRGQLASEATDVKLSSSYIGPLGRWYWLAGSSVDAYLQFGLGAATFNGEASNSAGTYKVAVTGLAFPLGLGAEASLSSRVRLGGQALAYLQKSADACETINGAESCKKATSDQNALPWRLLVMLTVMLGDP
jgi:hypothetical protein